MEAVYHDQKTFQPSSAFLVRGQSSHRIIITEKNTKKMVPNEGTAVLSHLAETTGPN